MNINPNESTAEVAEPVTQSGGNSPVTFDDLDKLSTFKTHSKFEAQAKPEPKVGTQSKKKEADAKDEEVKEQKDEGKSDKQEVAKDTKGSQTTSPSNVLKLKIGDQEVDVPGETLVPVKIAGKIEQVSISELRNGYSGQSHLSKEFATFKKERDTFHQERDNLDYLVKEAHDRLINQKDLRGFIDILAESMGADGAKVYADTVGNLKQVIAEYQELTPEQRRERELQEELDYHRKKSDNIKTQEASRKDAQTLETKVNLVMEQYGMDKETFVRLYDELKATGRYDVNKIDPDFIGNYYTNIKKIEFVDNLITTQYPDLENKDTEVDRISTLCLQLGATEDEMREVINQVLGESAEQKLSKKVTKLEKKAQNSISKPRNPDKDPLFFGEL